MRTSLLLLLGGCHGWLAIDPPGQIFEVMAFTDASDRLGDERSGPTFGMGWGDVDGDGWMDLWVGNHASQASLYVNNQDGTFTESLLGWMPDNFNTLYDAHGVAWADFDRDGDQDLIESVGAQQGEGVGRNRVFRNNGALLVDEGTVHVVGKTSASGRCPIPADVNGDGRVDYVMVSQPHADKTDATALFVQQPDGSFAMTAELDEEHQIPTALCGQLADVDGDDKAEIVSFGRPGSLQAYSGHTSDLLDVSTQVGLPPAPLLPYDVLLADLDNDLDNDLYLTRWNELSAAKIDEADGYAALALRVEGDAEGLTFRTTGTVSISLDPFGFWDPSEFHLGADCSGVSLAPDDMAVRVTADNADIQGYCAYTPGVDTGLYIGVQDGRFEVRLSSAAWNRGNIVVQSSAPLTNTELLSVRLITEDEERQFNRDRLFIRQGATMVDQGWNRGIQELTTCTSVAAGDYDNDMDLDLFLVCASPVENQPDMMYLNDGSGHFARMTGFGAEGTNVGRGDSVAVADYDQDGRLDLFVSNGYGARPFNQGPHQLFHNDSPNDNHWLEVDLVGTASTPQALGAKVIVRAGGVEQVREQTGGTHHMAQHAQRLHFGLAANTTIDEIEVRWPTGERTFLQDQGVDQVLSVVEPDTSP